MNGVRFVTWNRIDVPRQLPAKEIKPNPTGAYPHFPFTTMDPSEHLADPDNQEGISIIRHNQSPPWTNDNSEKERTQQPWSKIQPQILQPLKSPGQPNNRSTYKWATNFQTNVLHREKEPHLETRGNNRSSLGIGPDRLFYPFLNPTDSKRKAWRLFFSVH